MGVALATGSSSLHGEAVSSPEASQPPASSPSGESLGHQALSLLGSIHQTFEGVKDTKSADEASKTLKDIQKEMQALEEKIKKLDRSMQKKMKKEMKPINEKGRALIRDCKRESKRLVEARYYGSTALRETLEGSETFMKFVGGSAASSEN